MGDSGTGKSIHPDHLARTIHAHPDQPCSMSPVQVRRVSHRLPAKARQLRLA